MLLLLLLLLLFSFQLNFLFLSLVFLPLLFCGFQVSLPDISPSSFSVALDDSRSWLVNDNRLRRLRFLTGRGLFFRLEALFSLIHGVISFVPFFDSACFEARQYKSLDRFHRCQRLAFSRSLNLY
ncbi:hypothetical protein BJX68DRAFT_122873 [Aspergillus pseudodeflectus]|uniref:Secreted peptide n=1 Tax=Aspergillus pseudodeflectus TaxID=176178 RepID=A0ABR4K479_9EURO